MKLDEAATRLKAAGFTLAVRAGVGWGGRELVLSWPGLDAVGCLFIRDDAVDDQEVELFVNNTRQVRIR